jgi:hypothetical protein
MGTRLYSGRKKPVFLGNIVVFPCQNGTTLRAKEVRNEIKPLKTDTVNISVVSSEPLF